MVTQGIVKKKYATSATLLAIPMGETVRFKNSDLPLEAVRCAVSRFKRDGVVFKVSRPRNETYFDVTREA